MKENKVIAIIYTKYEKFLYNVKVYQAWNKLWSGYNWIESYESINK